MVFSNPIYLPLLGNIYNREDLKPLKDNAYNIFYMGINIGAFVCNFVAAYLRNKYGWGYAFAAAGVGLIIGLIIFGTSLKNNEIKECGCKKTYTGGRYASFKNIFVLFFFLLLLQQLSDGLSLLKFLVPLLWEPRLMMHLFLPVYRLSLFIFLIMGKSKRTG